MVEFERVPYVVADRFTLLAEEVRATLLEVGLPAALWESGREVVGAEIELDLLHDEGAGVWVSWRCGPELEDAAADAVARGDVASAAGNAAKVMGDALIALLADAGFRVIQSDNDYAPFAIRVLLAQASGHGGRT